MTVTQTVFFWIALVACSAAVAALATALLHHLEAHLRADRHLLAWMREQEKVNVALYELDRVMWAMHGVGLPEQRAGKEHDVPSAFERAFGEKK